MMFQSVIIIVNKKSVQSYESLNDLQCVDGTIHLTIDIRHLTYNLVISLKSPSNFVVVQLAIVLATGEIQ